MSVVSDGTIDDGIFLVVGEFDISEPVVPSPYPSMNYKEDNISEPVVPSPHPSINYIL